MSLTQINKNLGILQSYINKYSELSALKNFKNSITECITTPTNILFHEAYKEFYHALQILAFVLNSNLNNQIDFSTRQQLIEKQHDIIKISILCTVIFIKTYDVCINHGIIIINNINVKKIKLKPKCKFQNIYMEKDIINQILKFCENVPGGKWKQELCEQTNLLLQYKNTISNMNTITIEIIDEYKYVWDQFQYNLLRLMFKNFITFYNLGFIACLNTFLDQQIQLKIELLQIRNKNVETIESNKPVVFLW